MNRTGQLLHISIFLIFCVLNVSTTYSQAICDGDFLASEYCGVFPGRTLLEGNNQHTLLYMEYNESLLPQGPYNVQVNGVYFQDVYMYNFDPICCDFASISDFNYDMDLPGTYTFTVESIESLTNECVDNFNSPISVSTITVLQKPDIDIRYTCLPSGEIRIDVVLMENFQFYGSIYLRGIGNSPQGEFYGGSAGDIILSTTASLNPGQQYNIELRECNDNVLLLDEVYSHNCTSCVDETIPIAMCKNISLDLLGNIAKISPLDLENGSTDDCGILSYGINYNEFDCSHIGQNQVTFTVADGDGNVSTCNSVVTITDNASSCSSCGTIPQPIIEFSHTEQLTFATRIWMRITNINDYNSIVNKILFLNFTYLEEYESFFGSSFPLYNNRGVTSNSTSLSEFVYIDIDFDNAFRSCPVENIHLEFQEGLCDISYRSNTITVGCDNDSDGFDISVDCNDNNNAQYPGAIEVCDGVDNNCDGTIDEGFSDIFGLCCPFLLNVIQTDILSGSYNADYSIETQGSVGQTSTVTYKAGNQINMLPGFEVELGGVIHAYIAPCQ